MPVVSSPRMTLALRANAGGGPIAAIGVLSTDLPTTCTSLELAAQAVQLTLREQEVFHFSRRGWASEQLCTALTPGRHVRATRSPAGARRAMDEGRPARDPAPDVDASASEPPRTQVSPGPS